MPIYKVNGETYNIPDDKITAFEKRYPDARVQYQAGNDQYEIPLNKRDAFVRHFPNATLYNGEQPKVEAVTDQPKVEVPAEQPKVQPLAKMNDTVDVAKPAASDSTHQLLNSFDPDSLKPETELPSETTKVVKPDEGLALQLADQQNDKGKRNADYLEKKKANEAKMAEIEAKIDRLAKDGGQMVTYDPIFGTPSFVNVNDDINTLQATLKKLKEENDIIDAAVHKKASALGDVFSNKGTYDMGLSALQESTQMLNIKHKIEKGEKLTDAERDFAHAATDAGETAYDLDDELTNMYRFTRIAGESVPFMADFALTGGFGSIARAGANWGLKEATKYGLKGVSAWAMKALGTTAGDLAAAATLSNSVQLPKTLADMQMRNAGYVSEVTDENGVPQLDDQGNIEYGFMGGKSPLRSFYEGEVSSIIENYTEMFGTHLGAAGEMVKGGIKKGMEKVGLKGLSGKLSAIGSTDFAKSFSKGLNRMGVQDLTGEILEEEIGIPLQALFLGEVSDDPIQQQIDILGGIGLSVGFMQGVGYGLSGLDYAARGASYAHAKHKLDKADKAAEAVFTPEKWEPIRQKLDSTPTDDLGPVIQEVKQTIKESDPGDQALGTFAEYLDNLIRYRGFNLGNVAAQRDGMVSEQEQQATEAYVGGYNTTDPEAMNAAKLDMEAKQKVLEEKLGEPLEKLLQTTNLSAEDLPQLATVDNSNRAGTDLVLSFLNAKAKYEGMIQQVRDDIDSKIEQSNRIIDRRSNKFGMVQSATMKVDDRQVYVVNGNVVMNEDGNGLDRNQSSDFIVIRDAETGELETTSPENILRVDNPINAEDQKAELAQQIRQSVATEKSNAIDGILPFNEGDVYSVVGENGPMNISVVSNESGVVDNGDGTVNVTIDGQTVVPMLKDQIQQMSQQAAQMRVAQAQAEEEAENDTQAEEPQAEEPAYSKDQNVLFNVDGQTVNGTITSDANQDGLYEVYTEVPVNGKRVQLLSKDEIDRLSNPEQAETVSDKTTEANETVSDPDYETMPVADTIADLSKDLNDEEIDAYVAARKKEYSEALEEAQKNVPVMGTNKNAYIEARKKYQEELGSIQQKAAYWDNVGNEVASMRASKTNNEENEEERIGSSPVLSASSPIKATGTGTTEERSENVGEEGGADQRSTSGDGTQVDNSDGAVSELEQQIAENRKRVDDQSHALASQIDVPFEDARNFVRLQQSQSDSLGNVVSTRAFKTSGGVTFISDFEHGKRVVISFGKDGVVSRTLNEKGEQTEPDYVNLHSHDAGLDQFIERMLSDAGSGALEDQLKAYDFDGHRFNNQAELDAYKQNKDKGTRLEDKIDKALVDVDHPAIFVIRSLKDLDLLKEQGLPNKVYRDLVTALESQKTCAEYIPRVKTIYVINENEGLKFNIPLKPALQHEIFHWYVDRGLFTPEELHKMAAEVEGDLPADTISGLKEDTRSLEEYEEEVVAHYLEKMLATDPVEFLDKRYDHNDAQAEFEKLIDIINNNYGTETEETASEAELDSGRDRISQKQIQSGDGTSQTLEEGQGSTGEAEQQRVVEELVDKTGEVPTLVEESIAVAESETDINPSDAQKAAGNYKKGHVKVDGHDITIENPKGSIRSGKDKNGKEWSVTMNNTYGYILGTEGVDGDHIDVFLSDHPEEGDVYVVDQLKEDGSFDEHKCMYGFNSQEEAEAAYLANYSPGWKGLGTVTRVSKEDFKKWISSSHRKTKPFAEYALVKKPENGNSIKKNNYYAAENGSVFKVVEVADGVVRGLAYNMDDLSSKPVEAEISVDQLNQNLGGNILDVTQQVSNLADTLKKGQVFASEEGEMTVTAIDVDNQTVTLDNGNGKAEVPLLQLANALSKEMVWKSEKSDAKSEDQTTPQYHDDVENEAYEKELSELRSELSKGGLPNLKKISGKLSSLTKRISNLDNGVATESDPVKIQKAFDAVARLKGIKRALTEFRDEVKKRIKDSSKAEDAPAVKVPEVQEEDRSQDYVYELNVSDDGTTTVTRSVVMPNGVPVGDGLWRISASNPSEMKEILIYNKMDKILSELPILDYKIEEWEKKTAKSNIPADAIIIDKPETWVGRTFFTNGMRLKCTEVENSYATFDNLDTMMGMGYEVAQVQKYLRNGEWTGLKDEAKVLPTPNRLVTDERYEELRKKMLAKLKGQMNIGIDPEILAIGTEMAVYHIEKGARNFAAYAKAMIADLGDAIRPYLKSFYNGARELPEMEEAGLAVEMTPYEEVKSFDVANFDKATGNPLEQAEIIVKEKDVEKQTDEANKKLELADKKDNFVEEVKDSIEVGDKLNVVKLRALASNLDLDLTDIQLQELTELAIVDLARKKVQDLRAKNATEEDIFKAVADIYQNQPTISMRSGNRVEKQQYSTPIPLSYTADLFVNAGKPKSVLEPSAGNGMMVFAIDPSVVTVNEIDGDRLANLQKQGFAKVTSQDGTLKFDKKYDAVVTNPPFGAKPSIDVDGYRISGLDEQMVVNALDSMKDNGKAAIIIGGHTKYSKYGAVTGSERPFLNYLYSHFNVVDVINVNGDLYSKQGTSYPVRLILIDGKKTADETLAPVQSKARAEIVNTFDELFKRVNDEVLSLQESSVSNNDDGERHNDADLGSGNNSTAGSKDESRSGRESVSGSNRQAVGSESVHQHGNKQGSDAKGKQSSQTGTGNDGDLRTSNVNDENNGPAHGGDGSTGSAADSGRRGNNTQRVSEQPAKLDREPLKVDVTKEKTPYPKRSQSGEIGSVVPTNTAIAIDEALEQFDDIDAYVMEKLGYDSKDDLFKALSAEQVDSVALAIKQMENGHGFIIGDMTGVGKGRQAAALIRYAIKQGMKPIFMTEKANLFSDIYRDLRDIGSPEYRPFIFNDKNGNNDPTITDEKGNVVYKIQSPVEKKEVFESGVLPEDCSFAVLTYSQLNTNDQKKFNPKKTFFKDLAEGNILIMDESHNAGGEGNTGKFLQDVVPTTKGVTFLSGTFAKRADNMPIYALKTNMSDANMTTEELIQAILTGGVPLQEIMSRNLVESGQMIRRERDYTGVTIDWLPMEGDLEKQKVAFNNTIELFNDIIHFQRKFIDTLIEDKNKDLAELQQELGNKKGTKDLGISNVPFASKTFNLVRQLLFSLKAEYVADRAIQSMKEGLKPVIAVANTMEGFMNEVMPEGIDTEAPDFSIVFEQGLESVMKITKKDARGNEQHSMIPLSELSEEGQAEYHRLKDKMKSASVGLSVSPIDVIKDKIRKAGYSVGELTGRTYELQFNDDGTVRKVKRQDTDKKKQMRQFNNGDLDVLILNQSASTGISLHASNRFNDQRQRIMIFAQNQLDVNTEVQMRGRTDRTGQVHRSKYEYVVSPIPAEGRLMMMFKSKLKSLDANTTSSQKSKVNEMEIVDFLNKYGDQVVVEYLKENRELSEKLLDPLGFEGLEDEEIDKIQPKEGDASKVAGRVALLSVEEQENFYKDVSERYNTLMNYLNETGSNDLEITTMPLRAETKSKKVLVPGKDPDSTNAFAQDSYLEEVEVDILKKPMKAEEVRKAIDGFTKGMTPREYRDACILKVQEFQIREEAKLRSKFNEELSEKLEKARTSAARKAAKATKATEEQKEQFIEQQVQDTKEKAERAYLGKRNRLAYKTDLLKQIFGAVPVGRTIMVPSAGKDGSVTFGLGVLLGFKINEKMTPSTTTAIYATLDGRRKVEIPLSKSEMLASIVAQTRMNLDAVNKVNLDNWDEQIPDTKRKTAHIVTGNILQAMATVNGQLISYSTIDGTMQQGILLPDSFKPSDAKKRVPITEAEQDITDCVKVTDATNTIELERKNNWSDNFFLRVPLSKTRGGKFFLDKDLKKLSQYGDFFQKGGKMEASIPLNSLKKTLKLLSDKFGASIEVQAIDDNSKDVMFRKKDVQGVNAAHTEAIVDEVNRLSEILHTPVRLEYDTANIPGNGNNRNAKGWYDPRSGEIVIYVPNAESMDDATQTVLHEAVAHKGLRKLFGEHFDTFLYNVYNNASEEIRERINALMAKNGWDMYKATDEYLASLAERTNFEEAKKQGWWQKVKDLFIDLLAKVGVKLPTLTDNELRYILWKSYENLKNPGHDIFSTARDIARQSELGVGNYAHSGSSAMHGDEVVFRKGGRADKPQARDSYERRVSTGMYQVTEAFQDSMLGLKEAYKAIEKANGRKTNIEDIAGFENAYLAENALSSKNMAEMDAYKNLVFAPVLKEVVKLAKNKEEEAVLKDYLFAKHGLERNVKMAENDAEKAFKSDPSRSYDDYLMEYRERDYSGLTALMETKNVTDAEIEADQFVKDYELKHDTAPLWKQIKNATAVTLSKQYESGLISKDVYDGIKSMYDYYVPLRGWDEKTSDEEYSYLTHKKSSFNAPIRKALGRTSKADDPLATIANMAESGIMEGNRNLMKLKFLNYVLNNPSDLVSVNSLWVKLNDVSGEWEPVFAQLDPNDTPEEVELKVQQFEQKMESLAQQEPDKYRRGRDTAKIPYKVVRGNGQEHRVLVKRNGETFVLTINGNPRAAQALNGLTNPDNEMTGAIGAILNTAQWTNRQLSAFYTTRNPDFVVSNFFRDMLYTNSMVWVKEKPKYARKFHANFGKVNPAKMYELLNKYRHGRLDMNDETEKMFNQFMLNGGETGYANLKDLDKKKKEIEKELKMAKGKIPAQKAWGWLGDKLDDMNRAVENCARFATFVTSRQMGRTIERSIWDAKEISINFNKKGSGSKFLRETGQTKLGNVASFISGTGRVSQIFWNAAIQGTANVTRNAKRNPKKFIAAAAAVYLLGQIIPLIAGGDGDDDDKNAYYNLPEYVRRSNIMFRIGDQWVAIPLPVEYRSLYGLGELSTGVLSGRENLRPAEVTDRIASQFSQLLPVDFMEGEGGLSAFVPSQAKPLKEAMTNKSWTGLPIYKDTPFNKNMPEWTKGYKNANSELVWLSRICNEATGGDKYSKGWCDFNPAVVEHLLKGTFGGYANVLDKLVKTGETVLGEREFDWRNILLANRLVKAGDERTAFRKSTEEYFKYLDEYEKTRQRLKGYENEDDLGVLGYAEKLDFLENSPQYERYEIINDYNKDIQALRDELKEVTGTEDEKDVKYDLDLLISELVKELHETEK